MDCGTPGSSVLQSPRVCSNSSPLSQWCYLTISYSADAFSSCPRFFPASGSFLMNQLFFGRWPMDWSFSSIISPSSEYSGLISFRIDWFDLTVQGTLRSLLERHSSKATVLWCLAFVMVKLLFDSCWNVICWVSCTRLSAVSYLPRWIPITCLIWPSHGRQGERKFDQQKNFMKCFVLDELMSHHEH